MQALPCGVLLLDVKGNILDANERICALLGYACGSLAGKPFESILTISARIFFQTHFVPLLQMQTEAEEIFFNLSGKTGQTIPVIVNGTKKNDVYLLVLLRVLQRHKYEDELLRAKKVLEQALAENAEAKRLKEALQHKLEENEQYITQLKALNAEYLQLSKVTSHHLAEPIRKMLVTLDAFPMEIKEGHQPALKKMGNLVLSLRSIITGLHSFIAIDFADQHLVKVDLYKVIQQATSKARMTTGFNDFILRVDPLPIIEGYNVLLESLFFEVIKNAITFRSKERQLFVHVQGVTMEENIFSKDVNNYKFAEYLKLQVKDNGIGMEPRFTDYVFEVFNKIDRSTENVGVGLSIVKKIVTKHKGKLQLDSKPGEGTTITILLPVNQSNP